MTLTEPQYLMLEALRDACDHVTPSGHRIGYATPRQLAQIRWPDSPAWDKRTNMRGGKNGAVGGTMPMKAASVLWRLFPQYALVRDANQWSITDEGRAYLEGEG